MIGIVLLYFFFFFFLFVIFLDVFVDTTKLPRPEKLLFDINDYGISSESSSVGSYSVGCLSRLRYFRLH